MKAAWIFTIVGIVSMLIGIYILSFLLKKSKKYTLKKANTNGIRWGSQKKPVSGGFVFVILLLISGLVYFMIFKNQNTIDIQFLGIYIACVLAFMMGLADDILNTSPYFKFGAQLFCGIVLVYFDVYINISEILMVNYIFTILWTVLLMNSFNMLDNMDAISGVTSLAILSGLFVNTLFCNGSFSYSFISMAVVGALISFLFYNWSPSKLYMGDNGSQLLGAVIAALSIKFLWNTQWNTEIQHSYFRYIPVILAFVVPLSDTVTVTINRILKGKSPFVGGKDHTTHFLFFRGFSERQIALIFFFTTLFSVTLSVYIINFANSFQWWHFAFTLIYALLIFLLLFINTKITKSDS